ncbi:Receptor-type guanylate cyclase gcy [Seminavis robusta]|uniref:Receptor-type guanylate cyclase gcy n=1 Tax=Seminavis robusta TaxID=568900 RepID=A0A9N8E8A4_9STRA|nr:Receptor-type guanylate cyclase gcy [Seminavis robusta]|eukprot:Sro604_g174110.1 Receptor-type guanylate cyclase gcy (1259) ;mRNA; r:25512-29833
MASTRGAKGSYNVSSPRQEEDDDISRSSSFFDDEDNSSSETKNTTVAHDKSSPTSNAEEATAKKEEQVAQPETLAVRISWALVLLVMVGAAVTVSLLVYLYMKQDQETALEDNFYDLANRLVEGFHANTKLRCQTLDMMSLVVTSAAMSSQQSWPLVTMDDFEAIATAARTMAGSDYLGLVSYVTNETRKDWEYYTTQNTAWINESYAYQEDFKKTHNRTVGSRAPARALRDMDDWAERWLVEEYPEVAADATAAADEPPSYRNVTFDGPGGISTEIFRYGSDEEGVLVVVDDSPGPYYPTWQTSPAREFANYEVNYNTADPAYNPAYSAAASVVRITHTAIFGGVWNVDDTGYINENDDYDYRTVPVAALMYPVFDTILGGLDRNVVAVFDTDVEFGALFTSVLPSESNKLMCVVRNTCGQVFSYEVEGGGATYLGADDMHDTDSEHFLVETLLADFDQAAGIYNGAPINKDFCPWVLSVYGTQELHDAHINNQPIYFMCAVLGIFLFTLLCFLLYDCLVERRQRKVVRTARNSEKIVSSLFPKAFRDMMYAENNHKEKQQQSSSMASNMAFRTGKAAEDHREQALLKQPQVGESIANTPPMAELYPDCTVFFADVAGFTAWSSSRYPVDVFRLLETLYGAFDKLAKKHMVFKIETIGDCYVAVTGLPVAQPNHALLMIKFARGCLAQMSKLTRQLEGTLGPDTGGLALRVGLHSGPVTAGVLRGEKARFQLFGDTVNTAARMESNGQRNRIHVSQETADILIGMGKEHWVAAREELVHCKGKGDLQTFFIRESVTGSVASTRSTKSFASNTSDEKDVVEVTMALDVIEVDEKMKINWIENNCKRIRWVADVLQKELEGMACNQGSVQGDPTVWENESFVSSDGFSWDEDFSTALLSPGIYDLQAQDTLSDELKRQLMEFVSRVAFECQGVVYNFDQSCHALMSLDRMLKQLPDVFGSEFELSPLAKFTCMFATLIRNLSPPETPDINQEGSRHVLHHQSVSQSRSAKMALELLKEDRFDGLQQVLCKSNTDFQQFWGLVQNFILATDQTSGVLSEERNQHWDLCFPSSDGYSMSTAAPHQKAVPVLEHIMLFAEEGHAVQHWETYVKWSALFKEEFKCKHGGKLPQEDLDLLWDQSQLEYFDSFILPISNKVHQAGILGAVGAEFLTYASQNRQELGSLGLSLAPSRVKALGKTREEELARLPGVEVGMEPMNLHRLPSSKVLRTSPGPKGQTANIAILDAASARNQPEFDNVVEV